MTMNQRMAAYVTLMIIGVPAGYYSGHLLDDAIWESMKPCKCIAVDVPGCDSALERVKKLDEDKEKKALVMP